MKSSDSLRVLHVVGQLDFGGVSTWLKALRLALPNVEMDICCNYRKGSGELTKWFQNNGFNVYHIPFGITYGYRLSKLISTNKYDVLHDHRSYLSGWTLRVGANNSIPVRIMFHHTTNDFRPKGIIRNIIYSKMRKNALMHCTDIWGCAKTVIDALYPNRADFKKYFRVIYSAVPNINVPVAARDKIRDEFGIDTACKLLGFIGRVTPQKNPLFVIDVFKQLSLLDDRILLLFVGDGPLLAKTIEYVDKLGLSHKVVFTGQRSNVLEIMTCIDALFMPSLWEGLPITILEALNVGLPVVASDIPGILEALPEELHKYCKNVADAEGFVEMILTVLRTGKRTEPNTQFLEKFTLKKFGESVIQGYKHDLC